MTNTGSNDQPRQFFELQKKVNNAYVFINDKELNAQNEICQKNISLLETSVKNLKKIQSENKKLKDLVSNLLKYLNKNKERMQTSSEIITKLEEKQIETEKKKNKYQKNLSEILQKLGIADENQQTDKLDEKKLIHLIEKGNEIMNDIRIGKFKEFLKKDRSEMHSPIKLVRHKRQSSSLKTFERLDNISRGNMGSIGEKSRNDTELSPFYFERQNLRKDNLLSKLENIKGINKVNNIEQQNLVKQKINIDNDLLDESQYSDQDIQFISKKHEKNQLYLMKEKLNLDKKKLRSKKSSGHNMINDMENGFDKDSSQEYQNSQESKDSSIGELYDDVMMTPEEQSKKIGPSIDRREVYMMNKDSLDINEGRVNFKKRIDKSVDHRRSVSNNDKYDDGDKSEPKSKVKAIKPRNLFVEENGQRPKLVGNFDEDIYYRHISKGRKGSESMLGKKVGLVQSINKFGETGDDENFDEYLDDSMTDLKQARNVTRRFKENQFTLKKSLSEEEVEEENCNQPEFTKTAEGGFYCKTDRDFEDAKIKKRNQSVDNIGDYNLDKQKELLRMSQNKFGRSNFKEVNKKNYQYPKSVSVTRRDSIRQEENENKLAKRKIRSKEPPIRANSMRKKKKYRETIEEESSYLRGSFKRDSSVGKRQRLVDKSQKNRDTPAWTKQNKANKKKKNIEESVSEFDSEGQKKIYLSEQSQIELSSNNYGNDFEPRKYSSYDNNVMIPKKKKDLGRGRFIQEENKKKEKVFNEYFDGEDPFSANKFINVNRGVVTERKKEISQLEAPLHRSDVEKNELNKRFEDIFNRQKKFNEIRQQNLQQLTFTEEDAIIQNISTKYLNNIDENEYNENEFMIEESSEVSIKEESNSKKRVRKVSALNYDFQYEHNDNSPNNNKYIFNSNFSADEKAQINNREQNKYLINKHYSKKTFEEESEEDYFVPEKEHNYKKSMKKKSKPFTYYAEDDSQMDISPEQDIKQFLQNKHNKHSRTQELSNYSDMMASGQLRKLNTEEKFQLKQKKYIEDKESDNEEDNEMFFVNTRDEILFENLEGYYKYLQSEQEKVTENTIFNIYDYINLINDLERKILKRTKKFKVFYAATNVFIKEILRSFHIVLNHSELDQLQEEEYLNDENSKSLIFSSNNMQNISITDGHRGSLMRSQTYKKAQLVVHKKIKDKKVKNFFISREKSFNDIIENFKYFFCRNRIDLSCHIIKKFNQMLSQLSPHTFPEASFKSELNVLMKLKNNKESSLSIVDEQINKFLEFFQKRMRTLKISDTSLPMSFQRKTEIYQTNMESIKNRSKNSSILKSEQYCKVKDSLSKNITTNCKVYIDLLEIRNDNHNSKKKQSIDKTELELMISTFPRFYEKLRNEFADRINASIDVIQRSGNKNEQQLEDLFDQQLTSLFVFESQAKNSYARKIYQIILVLNKVISDYSKNMINKEKKDTNTNAKLNIDTTKIKSLCRLLENDVFNTLKKKVFYSVELVHSQWISNKHSFNNEMDIDDWVTVLKDCLSFNFETIIDKFFKSRKENFLEMNSFEIMNSSNIFLKDMQGVLLTDKTFVDFSRIMFMDFIKTTKLLSGLFIAD